jgi:hypothetical protein
LSRHSWTPQTIQQALLLAAHVPFEQAAQVVELLTGMPLSGSSLHRLVQEYGGRLVEQQAAEAEATLNLPSTEAEGEAWRAVPEPDSEVMSVSMDGAMIHLREEGWKEVKTVAISALEPEDGVADEPASGQGRGRLTRHSYRAGLWPAAVFTNQQWAEATRRGLEKARRIVSVNDGALWIWAIVDMCYAPGCIEILDWWHAMQKLWLIARVLFGEGNEIGQTWVARYKDYLWSGRLRPLFHDIRQRYPRGQPWPDEVRQAVGYFFANRRRMRYRWFRQQGYPVGSGTVESACKVVVEGRLKQGGMLWSRTGAQAMLALRSTVLSDRWDKVWPTLSGHSKVA